MPLFRSRSPDEAAHGGEGWRNDPEKTFEQRFHDGKTFTPYVKVNDVIFWDLGHARHVPNEHEPQIGDLVLIGSCNWLRLSTPLIVFGCKKNGRDLSAKIPLESLRTFEVRKSAEPDSMILEVAATVFGEFSAERVGASQTGELSMSMMFESEHESALQDLRGLLERLCLRDLAPRPGPSMSPPSTASHPAPAAEPIPPSLAREERVDYWETDTDPEQVAVLPREADHDHEPARTGHRELAGRARSAEVIRPASPILTVSAEVAPETKEWLSFTAPSTELMLAHTENGGDDTADLAPGGVHAQGADYG
jgi:hypothetical protein